MAKYRQMLVDEEAHAYISDAKMLLSREGGKRLSSREVIGELIGRRIRYLRLGKEIRGYVNEFVSEAAGDRKVLGLLLFGSVAKNTFGKYSDIDIMVLVDSDDALDCIDRIDGMIRDVESARKGLMDKGLYLHISPLVLAASDLGHFRPIYINFVEEGIILFERRDALTSFLDDVRKSVSYERTLVNDTPVIRWRINKSQATR